MTKLDFLNLMKDYPDDTLMIIPNGQGGYDDVDGVSLEKIAKTKSYNPNYEGKYQSRYDSPIKAILIT